MKHRSSTAEFIPKAQKVHGNRYDYSRVSYVNTHLKVTIVCSEHGPFCQTPRNHISGQGCPGCGGRQQSNTEEFIAKARNVHGDKYDYSQVEYINVRTKVTIGCHQHGPFQQQPNSHLSGGGCDTCGGRRLSTTEEFIAKARNVHGDKYDYSQVEYINAKQQVCIICPAHGMFSQNPINHLREAGCPSCYRDSSRSTTEEFIAKARNVHGDKYDYSQVEYINAKTEVIIGCCDHGAFQQNPGSHLMGNGCVECSYVHKRASTQEFIGKAREVHADKYDYSQVEYYKHNTKVTIVCHNHGSFHQLPTNHLAGNGCPRCSIVGYSQKCIQWLECLSRDQSIHIQHAENGGEFKIPGTKWKADGYCAETNTIYEFHGDAFHGNPSVYASATCCHPYNRTVTAEELYQHTMRREEKIRALGYGIVAVWESEYDTTTAC